MGSHSRVLITGADGFTGRHLTTFLLGSGYEVFHLSSDLLDTVNLDKELLAINPDFVIHLAGISFAAHENSEEIYRVNTIGSLNLLESCRGLGDINRVILASSAAVYGNQVTSVLDEALCPSPVSHYGCSKLNMELLAENYSQYFPITVVRPFNYTGIGHDAIFVIPKIVKAFRQKENVLYLGNLDVFREFNDIRDICICYEKLLCITEDYCLTNICSGTTYSIRGVIDYLVGTTGFSPKIKLDKKYIRENDVQFISGNPTKMHGLINYKFKYKLENTLELMLKG